MKLLLLLLALFTSNHLYAEGLKVGDIAPNFKLKNQNNEEVSLSQYKGKKHVILAFSRAHW